MITLIYVSGILACVMGLTLSILGYIEGDTSKFYRGAKYYEPRLFLWIVALLSLLLMTRI